MLLGERKKKKKKNLALSRKTSYGFLAPRQKLEKTGIIPIKCLGRWKDGQKEGQTLFHRTLPATRQMKSKITQVEANQVRYFF